MQEMVPVEDLHVVENNPREGVGDVRELAASMKSLGVLLPLLVTPTNGILDGSRRFAAAKLARLLSVPVVRCEGDDPKELQEKMIAANMYREDLRPLEEATALQVLVDMGRDQKEVAKRLGRTPGWVSQRLSLLHLPDKAQAALHNGGISIEQARDLAKIADSPAIVDRIVDRIAAGEKITVSAAVGVEQRIDELQADLQQRKAVLEGEGRRVIVEERLAPTGGVRHLWDDDLSEHPDCSAVLLRIGYNRVDEELICTDPDRHGDADDKRKPDVARDRAEREAEKKVLELAKAGRLEAGREICRRMPMKQTTELIEGGVIAGAVSDWNNYTRAAAILELPVPGGDELESGGDLEAIEARVVEYAARSEKARHHAALALTMGAIEGHQLPYKLWTESLIQRYFALIALAGYEPSEAERVKLEPLAAEA